METLMSRNVKARWPLARATMRFFRRASAFCCLITTLLVCYAQIAKWVHSGNSYAAHSFGGSPSISYFAFNTRNWVSISITYSNPDPQIQPIASSIAAPKGDTPWVALVSSSPIPPLPAPSLPFDFNIYHELKRNSTFNPSHMSAQLLAPHWLLFLVFTALSIALCLPDIRRRKDSRKKAGHCKSCGYDLRASPDRCPECGSAAIGNEKRIAKIVP
jgi:hypothetical protein